MQINWRDEPKYKSFVEAQEYLDIFGLGREVRRFNRASSKTMKAKDILRVTGQTPAKPKDPHVKKKLKQMQKGKKIQPVLLIWVDGALGPKPQLLIADGFHRISAAFHLDEDTEVHTLLAGKPHEGN